MSSGGKDHNLFQPRPWEKAKQPEGGVQPRDCLHRSRTSSRVQISNLREGGSRAQARRLSTEGGKERALSRPTAASAIWD